MTNWLYVITLYMTTQYPTNKYMDIWYCFSWIYLIILPVYNLTKKNHCTFKNKGYWHLWFHKEPMYF